MENQEKKYWSGGGITGVFLREREFVLSMVVCFSTFGWVHRGEGEGGVLKSVGVELGPPPPRDCVK